MQANHFAGLAGVTVLPITGTLLDAPLVRVRVEPDARNGLTKSRKSLRDFAASQVMVDKPQTPARSKVGAPFGRLDDAAMLAVNCALALFLGLA